MDKQTHWGDVTIYIPDIQASGIQIEPNAKELAVKEAIYKMAVAIGASFGKVECKLLSLCSATNASLHAMEGLRARALLQRREHPSCTVCTKTLNRNRKKQRLTRLQRRLKRQWK